MNQLLLNGTEVRRTQEPGRTWFGIILLSVSLLGIWGALFAKLTTDWATNQQYTFGFFAPVLMMFLLAYRWSERPAADPTSSLALRGTGLVLLALLLPLRIIQEANPDWRPLNWVHAAMVVSLTLIAAAESGGLRWIKQFAPPLLLVFFVIPWPLAIEQGAIQFLTRCVAATATELLNLCHIPALQRGNVIEVSSGMVGVNEACSGIRSLAGTLMAGACLGEFYRLGSGRRVALLIGGILTAFALNLIRAFALSWTHATQGGEALERWHDPAGFVVFGLSFALLWAAAVSLAKSQHHDGSEDNHESCSQSLRCLSANLPVSMLAVIALFLVAIEVATETWYRGRETGRTLATEWDVEWPEPSRAFSPSVIPTEVTSILRYSEGAAGLIHERQLPTWSIYYLRWAPGRTSAQLAVMHRPEICLPATGLRHLGAAKPIKYDLPGAQLPFEGSIFEKDGRRVYVYRCLWEDVPQDPSAEKRHFDMSLRGRLQAAWVGRRNLGQRLLQISVLGARDEAAARADLMLRLSSLIHKSAS